MRATAPALLPLFRSNVQASILAQLFDPGAAEVSVTDLARRIGAPLATVAREVARLESHDVVVSRLVGHTKLLAGNWKLPYVKALAELVAFTAGLPFLLGRVLSGLGSIEAAYVFGSWAARYAGEPGPSPNDIDLLVVTADRDYSRVLDAVRPVARQLGIEINPVLVTPEHLAASEDPFLATVFDRPTVPIPLEPPS
jgi:predicted nucleotidyltransferase